MKEKRKTDRCASEVGGGVREEGAGVSLFGEGKGARCSRWRGVAWGDTRGVGWESFGRDVTFSEKKNDGAVF